MRASFGPDRVALFVKALEMASPPDERQQELKRIRAELAQINLRIGRLVTNLESEELSSEVAKEIRRRLEELARVTASKQRQLEILEEGVQESDPNLVLRLLQLIPICEPGLALDRGSSAKGSPRCPKFEARCDPSRHELT